MHDACVYLEFAFYFIFITTQYYFWSFSGEIKKTAKSTAETAEINPFYYYLAFFFLICVLQSRCDSVHLPKAYFANSGRIFDDINYNIFGIVDDEGMLISD